MSVVCVVIAICFKRIMCLTKSKVSVKERSLLSLSLSSTFLRSVRALRILVMCSVEGLAKIAMFY